MDENKQKPDYEIGRQKAGKDILQAGGNIFKAGRDVILSPALPTTAKSELIDAKNEIENIKEMALSTLVTSERIKAIDTLAVYGESAIQAIIEIGRKSSAPIVRSHALDAVRNIKS